MPCVCREGEKFKSTPFSRRETSSSVPVFTVSDGLNPLPSHEGRPVTADIARNTVLFKSTPFSRRETGIPLEVVLKFHV